MALKLWKVRLEDDENSNPVYDHFLVNTAEANDAESAHQYIEELEGITLLSVVGEITSLAGGGVRVPNNGGRI